MLLFFGLCTGASIIGFIVIAFYVNSIEGKLNNAKNTNNFLKEQLASNSLALGQAGEEVSKVRAEVNRLTDQLKHAKALNERARAVLGGTE